MQPEITPDEFRCFYWLFQGDHGMNSEEAMRLDERAMESQARAMERKMDEDNPKETEN